MSEREKSIRPQRGVRKEIYETTNFAEQVTVHAPVDCIMQRGGKFDPSIVKSFSLTDPPLQTASVTMEEVLQMWQTAGCLKHKGATEIKYDFIITKHIIPELGSMYLKDITLPLLNDFLYRKTTSGRLDGMGGLSPSYVRTIAVIVQSAIQYAIDEKLCDPIKIKTLKPPLYIK